MFVTGAWSVSALAASGPTCDNSGHRLQTLNVSVEALAPETVEHVGVAAETTAVPAPPDAVNEAIAPLLYLTPHIAAMLNSVFESTDNTAPDQPQVSTGPVTETAKAPTAASAPQATTSDTDDGSAPANAVFRNDDIARFQRRMYRKDI
ncbi:MAG: hypothetical protein L0Y45_11325 [Woeseiaceae bacterium]|nr:hypothetical protein [Woeseiaceae bacterium]